MTDDVVERLRTHAETWERIGNAHPSYRDKELLACLREAADEIEQFQHIRELCIGALMLATGATREQVEDSPTGWAKKRAEEIERLRAREKTLENTARINLKVAQDRGRDNERLRAALLAYDKAARDVQDHWADPSGYTHNVLLTPMLVHEETIAPLRDEPALEEK